MDDLDWYDEADDEAFMWPGPEFMSRHDVGGESIDEFMDARDVEGGGR